jgi:hypothetical protein
VKIRGTCTNCGREFLLQQVVDSNGHCPWCGKAFQPHYTAVLVEALQQVEAAGSRLEGALEVIAGMEPALVLDEEAILAPAHSHLERLRAAETPQRA